jgi:signal transduction histidine kinase
MRSAESKGRHRHDTTVPLEVALTPIQLAEQRVVIARVAKRSAAATPAVLDPQFLSILMHELRTPLQAMLGWTQLLRSARDPQAAERIRAALERNIRWQAQVIEDLLDLARILSGDLRLAIRRIGVIGIIESAAERISPAAQSKGVRLVQRLEAERGEILADPDRLAQVIWRLLCEAVRFSSEGGEIEIRLERVGSSIRITVTDDGGADDPASSHASGWFRGTPTSTDDFARFGVGLSNVQRVVEIHGGWVGAENAGPGKGARFHVTLPLAASSDGADEGALGG